jgi:hypothetical protein
MRLTMYVWKHFTKKEASRKNGKFFVNRISITIHLIFVGFGSCVLCVFFFYTAHLFYSRKNGQSDHTKQENKGNSTKQKKRTEKRDVGGGRRGKKLKITTHKSQKSYFFTRWSVDEWCSWNFYDTLGFPVLFGFFHSRDPPHTLPISPPHFFFFHFFTSPTVTGFAESCWAILFYVCARRFFSSLNSFSALGGTKTSFRQRRNVFVGSLLCVGEEFEKSRLIHRLNYSFLIFIKHVTFRFSECLM